MKKLTQEILKELLDYNQETGIFTRKKIIGGKANIGDIAGSLYASGYVSIKVNGGRYLAHRLAFLFIEGYFPEFQVDHINGNKADNRWVNLRHTTGSCNLQNQKIAKSNKSGFLGVYFRKSKKVWISKIMVFGKTIHIGSFKTPIAAAIARVKYEDNCSEWTCNAQDNNRVKLRSLGVSI